MIAIENSEASPTKSCKIIPIVCVPAAAAICGNASFRMLCCGRTRGGSRHLTKVTMVIAGIKISEPFLLKIHSVSSVCFGLLWTAKRITRRACRHWKRAPAHSGATTSRIMFCESSIAFDWSAFSFCHEPPTQALPNAHSQAKRFPGWPARPQV